MEKCAGKFRCGVCEDCIALKAITEHPLGCVRGGFSCQYWLAVKGCQLEHPNVHVHGPGEPCPLNV